MGDCLLRAVILKIVEIAFHFWAFLRLGLCSNFDEKCVGLCFRQFSQTDLVTLLSNVAGLRIFFTDNRKK
jgi:hypothetical protein